MITPIVRIVDSQYHIDDKNIKGSAYANRLNGSTARSKPIGLNFYTMDRGTIAIE